MDRKPILVIYLERQDLMQGISPQMQRLKDEYHIIILPGKENKCELLSSEKIEPVEIEELKKSLTVPERVTVTSDLTQTFNS